MNRGRQRHGARMRRRSALRFGVALTALLVAPAHTPYQQWVVYRRRVLLIGSSRDDPTGYGLGRQVAETLAHHLPESRSRASRAPTAQRLASLIATDQMDVAVLPWPDAIAMAGGKPPFAEIGQVALTVLYGFEDHVLVGRADFPVSHAYLVSQTLDRAMGPVPGATLQMEQSGNALPLHSGTRDYVLGRPMPDIVQVTAEDHDHPHGHGN